MELVEQTDLEVKILAVKELAEHCKVLSWNGPRIFFTILASTC